MDSVDNDVKRCSYCKTISEKNCIQHSQCMNCFRHYPIEMIGQVCNQKVQNGILRHPHVICGGNIIEAKMLQELFGMDYDRKKIAIQEICEHIWVPIKNNSICSLCGKKCEHYLSKQIDWNVGDSKGNCKICKIPVILDMRLKGGIVIVKTTKPLYEPVGIL